MKKVIVEYYTTTGGLIQLEIEADIIDSTAETIQLYKDQKTVAVFPLDSIIGAYFKPE